MKKATHGKKPNNLTGYTNRMKRKQKIAKRVMLVIALIVILSMLGGTFTILRNSWNNNGESTITSTSDTSTESSNPASSKSVSSKSESASVN